MRQLMSTLSDGGAFWCLFFALAVIAFATSCGNDVGAGAPVVEQLVATVAPVTTDPTPTDGASPTETGATLVLPRHGEPLLVNRGDNYVYGELSLSGDCLRISYVDPSQDPWTQDGLLLVWPAGFDVRTERGGDNDDVVVEVTGADGGVVAAIGQTLRVSGKHTSDRLAAVDEWDWAGGEVGHCAGPYYYNDGLTCCFGKASWRKYCCDICTTYICEGNGPAASVPS